MLLKSDKRQKLYRLFLYTHRFLYINVYIHIYDIINALGYNVNLNKFNHYISENQSIT